jgi:hypothetical protein
MRPKLKMAVRPIGSNLIGARNNICPRLLGRMDNTLNNGEVARMIAEQVAAQVELRVKSLLRKGSEEEKEEKRECITGGNCRRLRRQERTVFERKRSRDLLW